MRTHRTTPPLALLLLLAVGLAGCAGTGDQQRRDAALAHAEGTLEESRQPRPVEDPPAPTPQPTPPAIPAPADFGPLFDINVKEAPVREFIAALVEDTGFNVIVDNDVTGTISLQLRGVTVPEAMEIVREAHGYDIRVRNGVYYVRPAHLQTRTFHIDYLNVQRDGSSGLRVTAGQLDSENNSGERGAGSRLDTRSESHFWRDLRESLESLVRGRGASSGETEPAGGFTDEGWVTINPHSGIVVVRAQPKILSEVADFLDSLQEASQRQVVLEAKVLEVRLADGFQAGINWATLGGTSVDLGVSGTGLAAPRGTTVRGDVTPQDWDTHWHAAETRGDEFRFDGESGAFTTVLQSGNLSGFLQLLETQGTVSVLSSPRVSTMNNQKAVIKVGQDIFYMTDFMLRSVELGDRDILIPDPTFTPLFDGVALDVTPQIGAGNQVTLHIRPSVTTTRESVRSLRFRGEQYDFPLPTAATRESDSIVRARNGETVVIGGLMKEDVQETIQRTPFLGRIPLLGALFRQTQRETIKSELVILVRPLVVDPQGETWDTDLRDTQRRIQEWSGERRNLEM